MDGPYRKNKDEKTILGGKKKKKGVKMYISN